MRWVYSCPVRCTRTSPVIPNISGDLLADVGHRGFQGGGHPVVVCTVAGVGDHPLRVAIRLARRVNSGLGDCHFWAASTASAIRSKTTSTGKSGALMLRPSAKKILVPFA